MQVLYENIPISVVILSHSDIGTIYTAALTQTGVLCSWGGGGHNIVYCRTFLRLMK